MADIIRIGDSLIDFSSPKVMSIINVTPDSFYPGSRVQTLDSLLEYAAKAIDSGTAILDIGGCSTRPGSSQVSADEEYKRVRWAFTSLREAFPKFPISVDTYRASIVQKLAEEFGPFLVNDISGGLDDKMFENLERYHLPYVLCHMKGTPETMQDNASYSNLIDEMIHYFANKIGILHDNNIYDIIVDPNFGFAKSVAHNFELVRNFDKFSTFECPLLAGVSRKSFICKTALCDTESSLPATSAMHMALLERGARLLRVHDTEEAIQTISLQSSISQLNNSAADK